MLYERLLFEADDTESESKSCYRIETQSISQSISQIDTTFLKKELEILQENIGSWQG
jgi:hypothetical protein